MNALNILNALKNKIVWKFTTSAGPGGQNVNKVNSKVHLNININEFPSEIKSKIEQAKFELEKAQREGNLTKAGELAYGKIPELTCYAAPLNQVFMNLFSNAIDALREHPNTSADWQPTLSIFTASTEFAIVIRIADNGSGIPEAIRSKIFDPFFTTKPIGSGTGLGLSISYQIIVDKHKGNISCQSEPGKGTEFTIELPILIR